MLSPDFEARGDSQGSCGYSKPTKIEGIGRVVKIFAGRTFVLLMEEDGTLWSWGANNYGQV
ncbi:MAG: hypothetical protein GWN00_20510, partial [Aliifodinibius sp.]|nr:hypothetical protein [Fodinibius sp.]NIV13385.1 hypothetical protein [Fodinibius sp.]NIY27104.1 hypothetical protein [Fodinibius sp.]